jgi:type VI secretion system protein VasI
MRSLILPASLTLSLIPTIAFAQTADRESVGEADTGRREVVEVAAPPSSAFALDIERSQLAEKVERTRIGDLKTGSGGILSRWAVCQLAEGTLAVHEETLLQTPSEYTYDYEVTRSEDGLELRIAPPKDDPPEILDIALSLRGATSCSLAMGGDGLPYDESKLIPILTIDGASTLSALIEQTPSWSADPSEAPASGAPEKEDPWLVREESDEITDQPNVYLMAASLDPVSLGFGQTDYPTMVIRCQRNTTSVYVVFGSYEVNDTMSVNWRIDDEQAREERWNVSSDRKAVGLWRGGDAIPFLRKLLEGNMLKMRFQGRSDSYLVSYPIAQLRPHLEKVSKACNWSL